MAFPLVSPGLGILGRRILRVMSLISAPAGPAALAFENFLAVLTIIFLQHHLRLQLRRNQTERLGALRAADVINYTAGECLAMAGTICPLPRRSVQDRLGGGGGSGV